MNLREFVIKHVGQDERVAETAAKRCGCHSATPSWSFNDDEQGGRIAIGGDQHTNEKRALTRRWNKHYVDMFDARHIARHDPARVLRGVAGSRGVIDRHFYDGTGHGAMACRGCPTSETDGDYTIDHIDECPELQDLAWRWHDDPDWDPRWCSHYETRLVEETTHEDLGTVFMKTCTHCGAGLGRQYMSHMVARDVLEAFGLDARTGVVTAVSMGAETVTLELSSGRECDYDVRDLTDQQRAAIAAYLNQPRRTP